MIQQIQETSSIGATWPPQATSHERIRGFYPDVVATEEDAESFATDYFDSLATLRTEEMSESRLSIRGVVTDEAVAMVNDYNITVEAAIPLAHPAMTGLNLMYAGYNQPNRRVGSDQAEEYSRTLSQLAEIGPSETVDLTVQRMRYTLLNNEAIEAGGSALIDQFVELYKVFGYDEADVVEILGNPNNTIACIERDGEIISSAMAETGSIAIQGLGQLTLTEITEASTLPQWRARGLYRAVSGHLIASLVQQVQSGELETHAIYGESNLAMPGVVVAAQQNGRRFSHTYAERYGIQNPLFGILPQNFSINDGSGETTTWRDFVVSHVPLA